MQASATELSEALASRRLSSAELVGDALDRIAAQDPEIGAFVSTVERDELLSQAREIDDARARGQEARPYAGIPIAIKDNISVAGQRLTCGSKILEHFIPPYTSTAVERLRAAGLLVIGKTNLDEFGFGSSTENSAFFPTRNPHDRERVPGGSSGGSAAAVAAGMVPWALGTDTGGSVRQPAALCGVVGVRPSYGRISRYGLVAYASSMDQIGPLATTVEDATTLLALMNGRDPCDSTSVESEPPRLASSDGLPQLRVGVPEEYVSESCDAAVLDAIEQAGEAARALGWSVERVSLKLTDYALPAYYVIASVEAASNLARYDGVVYGYRTPDATTLDELITRTRSEGFGTEAQRRILLGTYAASAGYYDEYYGQACRVRQLLCDEFARTFEDVDVLLSPVSPTTAWPLGEKVDDPVQMYLSDVYSVPVALAGLPGIVIPCSQDVDGLPVGVQLAGPQLADELVLRAAHALERHLAAAG
jgi:aspartyl-tRNA(Asn)/glutamyl-tRNA(Gln) amidotransferase subunit A